MNEQDYLIKASLAEHIMYTEYEMADEAEPFDNNAYRYHMFLALEAKNQRDYCLMMAQEKSLEAKRLIA